MRTPTGCNWTVQSDATWITAAKSGIDRVSYSVAQNTSAASRPGTITIANQTFTFVQAGAGPSFSCVARSDPKTLRSEGITELIGDLILSCSGTAPPSIRGDVFVTFNLNVTSRLEGVQDFTDAVLLVNDPATVSVGTNAFKGKLTAPNVLRFSGVPIAAVSSGATTLRIKNVRLNAVLASSSSGSARFDIRSTISVPVTYPAGASGSVVVGTVADGLDASVGNPVPAAGVQILPVTFREKFVDGFKKQGVSGESGFVNPAVSPRAGVADTGTRLRLRINKVPSGVRVYAAVRNLNSPVTGAAQLFSADASGRGGVLQEGTALFGGAYLELSVAGEIATATWEVLEPLAIGEDVYTFNIAVQNANADQLNSIRKEMLASFAHVSPKLNANANEVVPRFRDILAAPRLVNLTVVSRAVFVGTRAAEGKVVSRAAIGNNYSFNYDVINSSSEKATGVDVRGNMPAEFVYTGCTVDGGTCQLNGSDVSATLGEVAGGQTVTIQVSARQVEVVESRFLLESSIAVRSNEADTDPRDNEASSSFVLESCSTPLTPSAATIGVGGGPGTFAINAACGDWTVQSTTDWITITGAKNGFGAANVSYTVAANPGSAARVGTILAASQQLNVTQAGTCAVTVNPNGNTNLPAVGKAGTIILATTQPACAWSGTSSAEWAQFFPASGTGNANLALTIYPNFGSQSRNATLIIGGQSVTMTQAGSTANSTARFLQSMYFGYLARLPSQGEIDFHANTLTKGLTRTDVAFNLFNSAEFNAGGRFVAGLYVGLLDRDPEFAGWLFQRRALFENAVDQTALVSNFMTSAEYIAKFGNPNPAQFVTLLYRYILLRDPSPAEVDFQVRNALSDGSLAKRIALAAAFLNAAEFKTGAGPRLSAFLLYSTLLQRAGSQADRDFQAEAIRKGTPLKDLIGAFLGTAEFTNLLN
ncbi:MAG: DUF4214 domain-containing protein [Bryobacteraceae bacterium]|nr:DUF4214 domain-containing protein [Bryobacteraceae bacterium]